MGFNAMQPGKVKKGDWIMLGAAVVVIVLLDPVGRAVGRCATRPTWTSAT